MKLREVLQRYGLRAYARRSWDGRAVIRTGNGQTQLEADGLRLHYAPSFEDAMADDWEILEINS